MITFEEFDTIYSKYTSTILNHVNPEIDRLRQSKREYLFKINQLLELFRSSSSDSYKEKIEKSKNSRSEIVKNYESAVRIKKSIEENDEKYSSKRVFSLLKNHKLIDDISISNDGTEYLNIQTKELIESEYNCNIGKFEFRILLDNSDNFYIKNLTYRVRDELDHWHVNNNQPCKGAWNSILYQAFYSYQLFLYIDTIFHYLMLSNTTHAYMNKLDWLYAFSKGANKNEEWTKSKADEIEESRIARESAQRLREQVQQYTYWAVGTGGTS
ncbi:MAG: hypothetical protein WC346_07870 [Methanogenium sp.]|jgi:hypothetical protein